MSSASTVSSNLRESASDARDGVRDLGKAAADASPDIQKDLQALREIGRASCRERVFVGV